MTRNTVYLLGLFVAFAYVPSTLSSVDRLRDAVPNLNGSDGDVQPSAAAIQGVMIGEGPIARLLREAASYAEAARQYRYPIQNINNATLPFRWVDGRPEAPARALVAYDASYRHFILAFTAEPSEIEAVISSSASGQGVNAEFNVTERFLSGVQVNAAALSNFWSLYSDADVSEAAQSGIEGALRVLVPSGMGPHHVTCTGDGQGGMVAQLCALWAGMQYPSAQVDLLTFNATWVGGNAAFNWTMSQLAQRLYALPYNAVNFTTGQLQSSSSSDTLIRAIHVPVELAQGAPGLPTGLPSSPRDPVYVGANVTGEYEDVLRAVQQSIQRRSEYGDEPYEPLSARVASMDDEDSSCEPVLCRVLLGARLSCELDFPSASNGSLGALPLFAAYADSLPIRSSRSAIDLGIVWLNDSATAAFVFQGAQTEEDWQDNFNVALSGDFAEATLSGDYAAAFPGVEVHDGFWDQFASVTYRARTREERLDGQLDRLTQGQTPQHVICTGHSLGAALADLCAAWAAFRYPNASITVATFGGPMAGNRAFSQLLLALVGRTYRVINGLDVVPALPPLPGYTAAPSAMWLQEGQLLLQGRPLEYELDELNWRDHRCNAYAELLFDANLTTSPSYIAASG